MTATTDVRAGASERIGRGGDRRAGGGHVVDEKHPSRDDAGRASNCGPARRAAAGRPVCGGPRRRAAADAARSPSSLATARARSSAWSNPRACRRGRGRRSPCHDARRPCRRRQRRRAEPCASASQGTVARVRQYLTRATSSRATPSYANGASHRSTPAGGGDAGGARQRPRAGAAHRFRGPAASRARRRERRLDQRTPSGPAQTSLGRRRRVPCGVRPLRRTRCAERVLVRRAEDAVAR